MTTTADLDTVYPELRTANRTAIPSPYDALRWETPRYFLTPVPDEADVAYWLDYAFPGGVPNVPIVWVRGLYGLGEHFAGFLIRTLRRLHDRAYIWYDGANTHLRHAAEDNADDLSTKVIELLCSPGSKAIKRG